MLDLYSIPSDCLSSFSSLRPGLVAAIVSGEVWHRLVTQGLKSSQVCISLASYNLLLNFKEFVPFVS